MAKTFRNVFCLDESLNFSYHIKEQISKAMKGTGIIKKLSKTFPQHSLITIYNNIYLWDLPNNEILNQKIERIEYNAALAITGAIKGTSQSKFYNELGFQAYKFRCWFRKLRNFYKIKTTGAPEYLFVLFMKPIIYTILVHQIMLQQIMLHFTAGLMYINMEKTR